MILQFYISIFSFALFFIFYGWYSKSDLPRIIGYVLIFILGGYMEPAMPGDVIYKSGQNETYVYGDNFTGYHWDYDYTPIPPGSLDVYLFHRVTIDNYTSAKSHSIAFLLMIIGALGFINTMLERRNSHEN